MTQLARRMARLYARRVQRFEGTGLWLLGHASRVWPVVLVTVVVWASWDALRGVHIRQVRAALSAVQGRWVLAAAGITAVNIAAVGLYDVVAFRRTRTAPLERWKFGAVAFAWSNFLTLGPVAGPAIRFWLYQSSVSELRPGIVAIATAFITGLAGWTSGMLLLARFHVGVLAAPPLAFLITAALVVAVRRAGSRFAEDADPMDAIRPFDLAVVGWLDWMIAGAAFLACLHAAGAPWDSVGQLRIYFLGQVLGLASLIPGGLGGADAFWIAHLPTLHSIGAAADALYRLVYYVIPWSLASMLLLSWATRRAQRRVEIARRVMAALTGAAGLLIILSSASPALHARLVVIERVLPLPLVEAGQLSAASAGLLLLMLARGLARGYRAAFQWTMALLSIAAVSAVLKGLDWEEALVLGGLAAMGGFYASLFDRESHGDRLQGGDVALALAGVAVFVVFGTLAHRLDPAAISRWSELGYRLEAMRFVRTAAALALWVGAVALYVSLRVPVRFERPAQQEIAAALDLHARLGGSSTPLMIANGDKAIFRDGDRGLCAYRTIGPYLVVFADPVVGSAHDRPAFLEALFRFSAAFDRRPLFYQISPDWIPSLHDRGYAFFKLGEEAHLPLERVTLEGHAGKMNRQILRRGERDGARFRVMPPVEVARRLPELRAVSNDWLRSKAVTERQFSIGFFDDAYLQSFPCAVVEATADGRVLAFANLLRGPQRVELSIDLMRYRSDGPRVMDYLFVSLFLYGKELGYQRFNLGMAPLASVGQARGAHARERLANLLFQHGEHWYNFQGLRYYKQKWEPEWHPRYMGYAGAWEWPFAIAYVSALIAGGWGKVLQSGRGEGTKRTEATEV